MASTLTLVELIQALEGVDFVAIPRINADGKAAVTIAATGADGKRCFINRDIVGRDESTMKAEFGWVIGNEMVARARAKA